ncbi:MAG: hypothetical protein L6R28_04795 [Planctomycetes bacterium]|nr:hypothetical protein [Planctomycetota bacterium]
MSRSSIFNFESFQGFRPPFPATALSVVALIAGLELGLRALPDAWLLVDSTSRLGLTTFYDTKVIPLFEHPQVVIVGTSRAEDAVAPAPLDKALGLPEWSTMNLGLAGARPYDGLSFYEDHRERMKQAKLVIYFSDEWHFSSGWGLGWRYFLRAPLDERLRLLPPGAMPQLQKPEDVSDEKWAEMEDQRMSMKHEQLDLLRTTMLTDWVFQMRLKLRYIPKAIAVNFFGASPGKQLVITDEHLVQRPEKHKDKELGPPSEELEKFRERVDGFYENFDTHPLMLEHVRKLARMVKEDGGRFVIVQMPNRKIHQDCVEKYHPVEYRQHADALHALGQELGVPVYVYRYPSECGLEDIDYLDYGHLARRGCRRFTAFLAGLIKRDKLLEPAADPKK